jgi:DNA polymerase V
VQAGFPSPAEDYIENEIDLNAFLVKHPSATFLVRASGNSMKDAGISDGDVLVVDRSVKPVNGKVVIAAVDGQLTVKFLIIKQGKAFLMPANADYYPIPVDPENGVTIWGVVTSSIHQH